MWVVSDEVDRSDDLVPRAQGERHRSDAALEFLDAAVNVGAWRPDRFIRVGEAVADTLKSRSQSLDIVSGASHGFTRNRQRVGEERLVANAHASRHHFVPDLFVLAFAVSFEPGCHGRHLLRGGLQLRYVW